MNRAQAEIMPGTILDPPFIQRNFFLPSGLRNVDDSRLPAPGPTDAHAHARSRKEFIMRYRQLLALLLVNSLVGLPALAQVTTATPISPGLSCKMPVPKVDPRRSLFVTEVEVVQNAISLEDVLGQLARESRIPGLEAIDLWDQWWDTQNTSPGLGLGPNCDDVVNAQGEPAINGFPIECPRNEGAEINATPFDPFSNSFYEPIALVNRMDLMPEDGSNCGEYRVIFARRSGQNNGLRRNLLIFEATLPNPNPGCEADGCRAVAEFWARLSQVEDPMLRARMLRGFYLRGLPDAGVEPVIRIGHFGPGAGQIRTNQFLNTPASPVFWQLREYKLAMFCTDSASSRCGLQFVPVTVKTNPWGDLFDENSPENRALPFMRHFITQVDELAAPDLNGFFNTIPDRFNAGQSNSQGSENDYVSHFDPNGNFARAIDRKLSRIGSALTPSEIIRRSQTQSCAGCHQLNNQAPASLLGDGLVWRPSLNFVHVTEQDTDIIGSDLHFRISPALEDVFIPHRERVFERYLASRPCTTCVSLPLTGSGSGPDDAIITTSATADATPLPPSAEEVRRLDLELRAGETRETIGGSRSVH